jgi:hypothetical protein
LFRYQLKALSFYKLRGGGYLSEPGQSANNFEKQEDIAYLIFLAKPQGAFLVLS